MAKLQEMEKLARAIGQTIAGAISETKMSERLGFTLLIFDFGAAGGDLTYISNAERECMIKTLRECADKIESGGKRRVPS